MFRNFFEDVARNFADAIVRNWSERLGDLAYNFLFGGPSGGGALAYIFGSGLGRRQFGGPVFGGTPYLVGERGPEVFLPNVSGYIAPNAGGVGNTVVVNASTNVAGSVRSDEDLREIARQQELTINRAVAKVQQQQRFGRMPNRIGS